MKKSVLLLILVIFLVIPVAFSATNYNETGNFDTDYQLGTSIFNSQLNPATDVTVTSRIVTNPRGIPLVTDLDGDGTNEIIVFDLPLVKLYHDSTLDVIAGENIGVTERVSNIITFDIDDDNLTEIIFVLEESQDIRMLEWNGTSFHNDSSISLTELRNVDDGEFMIKCGKPDNCLMVYTSNVGYSVSLETLSATAFSSTALSSHVFLIENITVANRGYCLPKIRSIAYENYNGEGNRYIFSAMKFIQSTVNDILHINYMDVSDNLTITQEHEIVTDTCGLDDIEGLGASQFPTCDIAVNNGEDFLENTYTSVLVFDIEDESDGLETVVGVSKYPDEFKLCSYFNPAVNPSEMDDYPELAEADGALLSNPFRANIIEESGNFDFCVLGFEENNGELDMLCANERDVQFPEDTEYKADVSGNINLSLLTYRSQSILAHSLQTSGVQTDAGFNLDEVLSSYGVFSPDPDDTFEIQGFIFIKTLNLIFDNPKDTEDGDAGSMIAVDAEKINIEGGSEDLIFLNPTNLYYIDDGRSNLPVNRINATLNPCIDSVWKLNTSFEADIRAFDPESDDVNIRVILYADDSNEQDSGFLGNYTSGQEVTVSQNSEGFPFSANKTITNGIIRISARDVENLGTVISIDDIPFNVGINGVEFNDCTSAISTFIPTEEEVAAAVVAEGTLTVDATDNSLTTGLNTFIDLTGLGGTTIWLFLMITFSLGIWLRASHIGWSGNSAFGTIAIVNVLFIVLGARIGVISTGLVVIMTISLVVILGVFAGKFLTGLGTGGNGGV